MATLELAGLEAMIQRLQRLATSPLPAVREALRTEGNQIIRMANTLVPVDTGLLRSTGHVEEPRQQGPVVTVAVGYGQGMAPYAARIEFDVTLNHPHGGQAHFLQAALLGATAGMPQRLADAIRPALGGP
jgi:ABC-type tungstate transport system permease subunit